MQGELHTYAGGPGTRPPSAYRLKRKLIIDHSLDETASNSHELTANFLFFRQPVPPARGGFPGPSSTRPEAKNDQDWRKLPVAGHLAAFPHHPKLIATRVDKRIAAESARYRRRARPAAPTAVTPWHSPRRAYSDRSHGPRCPAHNALLVDILDSEYCLAIFSADDIHP